MCGALDEDGELAVRANHVRGLEYLPPAREQEGLEGADGSVLGGPALVRDVGDEDAGQEKVLVKRRTHATL